jgi:hypothetical protein
MAGRLNLSLADEGEHGRPTPGEREPIERLRAALADEYEVQSEIGAGGMGRVYLARDRRHGRLVAIKVLHSEVATALGRERFRREIAIAASLVHPNILPLYDSGSTGGLFYYVMPYVEGESLRSRLEREGRLLVDDAVRITTDVAAALDHAHGRGIVHRDIKPENILLVAGRALLADFGLAMTTTDRRRSTLAGHVVGTPAYMSPEQGAPGSQMDRRSDIYALACVVYEMLAGEPPFVAATAQAVLIRHAVDPVPPLGIARRGIPAELELAVRRALAKSPSDRPAEAGLFAQSLAVAAAPGTQPPRRASSLWRALPLAGLLLAAALPYALERSPAAGGVRATTAAARWRLSVERFVNRTGDPVLEYFGLIAGDWLVAGLAASGVAEVAALSASGPPAPVARGRPTGPSRAGAFRPHMLVSGSYYRAGAQVAVQAMLVEVLTGRVIFAAEPVYVDPNDPLRGLERLRDQLVSRLSSPHLR